MRLAHRAPPGSSGGVPQYQVWNKGWRAADVETFRARGVTNILRDFYPGSENYYLPELGADASSLLPTPIVHRRRRICTKAGRDAEREHENALRILHAAERYNGEQISVPATYRVAYEASAIYCLSCSESGEVWVEFDTAKGGEKAGKAVDRLVRTREMVNGVFTGGFHSGGDMATCLRIDISYRWAQSAT